MVTGGSFMIVPRYVLGKGYIAPSDKINIGIIGLGRMGSGHARRFAEIEDAQIMAGCDLWAAKQQEFTTSIKDIYDEKGQGGNGIETFEDYRELISHPNLDAVIVATPDHWHALAAADALKAGKDVYCEKPLTHTVEEGRMLVSLAKEKKRIFQTGSQQRSNKNFRNACSLVRNGYIGELKEVWVNVGNPAIDYNLPMEMAASTMDWDRWCGPSQLIPYNHFMAPETNKIKFWPKWRDFKETGGGILSDWGAHMFDIAQWGMGMDHTGPVKLIPPDYPNDVRGLKLLYANGVEMIHKDFKRGWAVRFIGSEGTVDISRGFFDSSIPSLIEKNLENESIELYKSESHQQNWLDGIRNRKETICPAEVGHRTNTINCIANIAYWMKRPLEWNPTTERFTDEEANQHLSKKNRMPYN